MGKIGQIRVNDRIGTIDFFMDGNRLAAVHKGIRYWIDDTDIKDEYKPESSAKDQFIDSGVIGLEPGKKIWMPYTVLKTRDVVRTNRKNDDRRNGYLFIYEQYEQFGLVEFATFSNLFMMWHEGNYAIIEDEMIKHTEKGIQIPVLIKNIHVPHIYIPEYVLKTRDIIRAKIEHESHFKPIGEADEIKFFLNDDSQLVLRRGKDEITATGIETIHGRSAVNVEAFGLSHSYVELPAEVEEAFRKTQGDKIPEGLKLISAGKSLLNGREYFKFSQSLPEEAFKKVQMYFEAFEGDGEFSGWLTKEPAKVAEALKIAV